VVLRLPFTSKENWGFVVPIPIPVPLSYKDESVIIYCFSRKDSENITHILKNRGLNAIPYHAGLDAETRRNNQELFIKNKANIINMSFVGVDDSALLRDIIKQAYDAGILVVVAAGNTDPDQTGKDFQKIKMYPVCSDSGSDMNFVIGVASIGKNNRRSLFSNYGDNCVDISAPGNVSSTGRGDKIPKRIS